MRASDRRYREKNYLARRLAVSAYYAANRERLKAYGREYRQKNRDYYREYEAKRSRDPDRREKLRQYRHIRHIRRRSNGGEATYEQVLARVEFYGGCCWMCGEPATCIDHVIPISRGGTGWPSNLRPACHSCNGRKADKPISELEWLEAA